MTNQRSFGCSVLRAFVLHLVSFFKNTIFCICLGKIGFFFTAMPPQGSNVTCTAAIIDYEEAEILYDGLCFAFLIIQLRIFGSWYFKHTIAEFRAERILSSR